MKVYIVHLFTVCGGGERLSLEMARVLRGSGYEVVYITNSAKYMRECGKLLGLPTDYSTIERTSFLARLLSLTGRFTRYRRLLLFEEVARLISSLSDNLVIDSGANIPLNVDLSYIHYPAQLGTVESSAPQWMIYNWIVERKVKPMIGRPRKLLTNSTWTARLVKRIFGLDAEVLYPPVDVERLKYDGRPKERIIVTISRLTPEKNLHLLPRVASSVPEYDWYLVGTMSGSADGEMGRIVYNRVLREAKRYNSRNFHVLVNLPRGVLCDLLQRASFYVHPPFREHFGIAVVEAMSAGAVPIVYRDGGAWTDVVRPIGYERLGYTNLEDIPKVVRDLSAEASKLEGLRERATHYASKFSVGAFREEFKRHIMDLIGGGSTGGCNLGQALI